jgi:hypothetical protein
MRKKAIKHLSGQPITRRRFELAASWIQSIVPSTWQQCSVKHFYCMCLNQQIYKGSQLRWYKVATDEYHCQWVSPERKKMGGTPTMLIGR